ncbi:MAG: ACT domain-containing protein [Clostridiales bacterium]|nr:ACT domain-containing protein [Clostridiales bacterium]MDY3762975.1 ACT domain-containing protein [Candidatus Ventricola sp.]MCI7702719.1 ACT domain-containing protein [Clostridiales bacterium]MDY3832681.1 ACT domain-containing protein [Candidatus Ventricola sp.]MDY4541713.1 ACT domain-containing protein [Candidatus Ventricola sp.]
MEKKNTAVVTVVGNDTIGIIARVSAALAHHEANILDISQTVLSGMFNMIMIVDISLSRFAQLSDELDALGSELGLQIRIQRSEIFDAMHRI